MPPDADRPRDPGRATARRRQWLRRLRRRDRFSALLIGGGAATLALILGVPLLLFGGDKGKKKVPYVLRVADFLPKGHVKDGSVSYRKYVQQALDSAAGRTLALPDYPVRVHRKKGQSWCLRVDEPLTLIGSAASSLRTQTPGVQVLRVEGADGVRLAGFSIEGPGGEGADMGHGLLQITGGRNVSIEDVRIRAGDADGIAISQVDDVVVRGCRIEGVAKSSIYLNRCNRATVANNVVTAFGGHWLAGGYQVGIGIQLSSNRDLVCADNVVVGGLGTGILCNALEDGPAPVGNSILGNRISQVTNPTHVDLSSGIRCANGAAQKATQTQVSGNSIRGCGAYGIHVENHGGSIVSNNLVVESERSGIVVGTLRDLDVLGNVVLNSGTQGGGTAAGLLLVNDARGVRSRGNTFAHSAVHATAYGVEGTLDHSKGGGHSLEPRVRHGDGPPHEGAWRRGDRVYDTSPTAGGHLGWVCTAGGTPGKWTAFGRIE